MIKNHPSLTGPSLAPALIHKAYHSPSSNYYSEDGTCIEPSRIDNKGDFTINSYFDIEKTTFKNLEEDIPLLTLGGDHSITYPILKAFYNQFGKMDILHIDAHSDLYNELDVDPYSHACPFYNIINNELAENLYQVGIRTLNKKQRDNAKKVEISINEMKDFESFRIPEFNNPLYVSLDIDALDPAFAPGGSHHKPGGLMTRQVIEIIQNINVPLIGADLVEYNSTRDINDITAVVCGKLFKEIVAKMIL